MPGKNAMCSVAAYRQRCTFNMTDRNLKNGFIRAMINRQGTFNRRYFNVSDDSITGYIKQTIIFYPFLIRHVVPVRFGNQGLIIFLSICPELFICVRINLRNPLRIRRDSTGLVK